MATPLIVVPPLTLWNGNGEVDCGATAAYAQLAALTWIDLFMLSGSIGEGKTSSPSARRRTLEIWAEHVPKERLFACVWSSADYPYLKELGVRPVVVLQELKDISALLKLLANIPAGSFIYSHPEYSATTFSPSVAEQAVNAGLLPSGAKISKISLADIHKMRSVVGDRFLLFDGRCRHIEASVKAGATGVVVVPFCLIPRDLPDRTELVKLQTMIDETQALVDREGGVAAQARMLTGLLRARI